MHLAYQRSRKTPSRVTFYGEVLPSSEAAPLHAVVAMPARPRGGRTEVVEQN